MDLYQKVEEAYHFLRNQLKVVPEYAIVAGTGLSSLADEVSHATVIPYNSIPHFPKPTVEGHDGRMVFGILGGKNVVVLKGRFHYYEGYDMDEVTFHIRVLKMLGVAKLIITNASGSLNPNIYPGHIVFIKDHINMQPAHPLRGLNDARLGKRFPPMDRVYDSSMLEKALAIAKSETFEHHKGIYVGLQGPSLETPAEYSFYGRMGGDVVGMSTVPEVIVAAQCELPVLCISLCTNNPFDGEVATSIEEVLEVAEQAGNKIKKVISRFIQEY